MKITVAFLLLLSVFPFSKAQAQSDRAQFIRVEAPVIALTHVRVIDGTGAAAAGRSDHRDHRRQDSMGRARGECQHSGKCADTRSQGLHRPAGTRRHA